MKFLQLVIITIIIIFIKENFSLFVFLFAKVSKCKSDRLDLFVMNHVFGNKIV